MIVSHIAPMVDGVTTVGYEHNFTKVVLPTLNVLPSSICPVKF